MNGVFRAVDRPVGKETGAFTEERDRRVVVVPDVLKTVIGVPSAAVFGRNRSFGEPAEPLIHLVGISKEPAVGIGLFPEFLDSDLPEIPFARLVLRIGLTVYVTFLL